ncbi:hypothetical protein [Phyllobacterium sp. K27]
MTRNPGDQWTKEEAASNFAALLDVVEKEGPQTIVDGNRAYEVRIVKHALASRDDVLDELGPLSDDDHRVAFGSDDDNSP